ncbi:DNA-binding protein [Paenibacillus brasilensis]|uniref:Tetratricopeptide (TPR) repeat protein n=1 Tax=Paenibacillus brasilensis TaxID=128574 RepID=A0ABU0KSB7_9BACL|nr:DNA-binding protein [Paenibacillus brasilensis]MDQ0492333.1 tetratricopeptide (TPR) repeat protein [Paenibacillus brasilensis]
MRTSILKSLKPDIIVEMLEMAVAFENWKKVMETADILYQCVQHIYEERQYHKTMELPIPHVNLERPLVYYFGLSHLMCGMAHQNQGAYEQARECIYKYAELGWMEDLEEEGNQVVEEFRFLAKTNLYAVDILSGNIGLIEEYVAFLQANLEEILPGLNTILQAALMYHLDVADILHTFAEQINEFESYKDAENISYYYSYCYHLALYYRKYGRLQDAVGLTLQAMQLTDQSGNDCNFKKCTALFESLRESATVEQISQYREMLMQCLDEYGTDKHFIVKSVNE